MVNNRFSVQNVMQVSIDHQIMENYLIGHVHQYRSNTICNLPLENNDIIRHKLTILTSIILFYYLLVNLITFILVC